MRLRHKMLLSVGLLAGALMLASTAVACTYLVGAAEAVGGEGQVTGYGEIGPNAAEGVDLLDAVAADYYMFTFTDYPSELPAFGTHGACHGDQEGDGYRKDGVQETPINDAAKVVEATEDRVTTEDNELLVCFASDETWHDRDGGGNHSPVYGTTFAPAHVL